MGLKTTFVGVVLAVTLGLVGTWLYAGKPFPGRYQIAIKPGDVGITMVDTATGKIRVFTVRRAGSDSYSELERRLEVFGSSFTATVCRSGISKRLGRPPAGRPASSDYWFMISDEPPFAI